MSQRRSGPIRSESARIAVLAAVARQLTERGYEHLTMEGIAHEAQVGKQTLYRWWPSKGSIVAESLLEGYILPERLDIRTAGTLRHDLSDWLSRIFTLLAEPHGEELVRSVIAAAAENADVGRRLRESLGGDAMLERLDTAVAAGELDASAPRAEIIEALVGAIIIRALSRDRPEDGASERIVAAVLGDNESTS